jgi:IS5 family transposase
VVQPLRPGSGDALYDSVSMRRFCGFELGEDVIPDEATILNFRKRHERHLLASTQF